MSDTEQSTMAAPDAQPPAEVQTDKTDADRIRLLEGKNLQLKEEKQKAVSAYQSQVDELKTELQQIRTAQKKAKTNADLEAGNFESVYKELQASYEQAQLAIQERDNTIKQMESDQRRSLIKTEFIRAASAAGAINPDHLLALKEGELQLNDQGQVRGFIGGVETDLPAYVEKLKQTTDAYLFRGSGAQGMSAAGSTPNNTGGKDLKTMSFTERLQLEVEQPELYARLKAAAG